LLRRGKLVRQSILYSAVSILFATILVIIIFITALLKLENAWLIAGLFICCMLSLMFSLIYFIKDINLSLEALKMELGEGSYKQ
jgi:amino acid permease